MKKVVIIDDEEIIREGLNYLIDWEAYGFTVVAKASNGNTGFLTIKEHTPDLVITDIRMPEMSGLEMIQKAKEEVDHPFQAVVLSGYSEFEYAQRAVSLGCMSYLLKPIDELELISILETLRKESSEDKKKNLKMEISNRLFLGDKSPFEDYKWINCSCFLEVAPHIIIEKMELLELQYFLLTNASHYYLIWLSNEPKSQLQKQFLEIFEHHGEMILSTGWLSAQQDLTIVSQIISQLRQQSYFYPSCLLYPDKKFERRKVDKPPQEILKELVVAMITSRQIDSILDNYSESMLLRFHKKEDLVWQTQEDLKNVLNQICEKLQKSVVGDIEEFCRTIREADSYPTVIRLLKIKLEELSRNLALELNNIDLIEQVTYYVNQHYEQELTLKDVADHFGYNSAYLGKKFKKKMTEPFLNYLERVRMEKAAELLIHSHLMVYEIADKVGYRNIDYFYKKFKHFYNISPNEFRRQKELE
ncbi:response regulator transcription factor [Streptococcus sp. S784/96/1]|uniref:response regulator transcription factor n=1 Tax=Streptococcus sp. S784/96/1 TaxID=2653499 RepID=UPI0013895F52|nr:response regulator [Streptococcus sp. S784/96/1]